MAVPRTESPHPAHVRIPRLSALWNLGPVVGAEIGAKLIALIATVHIARTTGPSVLGMALLTMIIVAFLDAAVLHGFEKHALRSLSQQPASAGPLIRRTLILRLGAAAGLCALLLISATVVSSSTMSATLTAGCVLVVARAVSTRWAYEALQNQVRVAWGRLVSQAMVVALILVFVQADTPPATIVLFWSLGELALALILFPPLLPSILSRAPARLERLKAVAVTSSKFGLATLLLQGIFTADMLLLGVLKGAGDAGVYGAAYRVVEGAWVVSNSLGAAFLPRVAAAARDPRLDVVLGAFWRLTALVAIPLAVLGFVLGDDIVSLLYGDQFQDAGLPLSLLLVATCFDFANLVFAFSLGMVGRENRMVFILAAGFLINLALNLTLIPLWGVNGAASAMLVSEILICVAAMYSFRGTVNFLQVVRPVLEPLRLCLPAAAVAVVLNTAGASTVAVLSASALVLTAACLAQYDLIRKALTEADAV